MSNNKKNNNNKFPFANEIIKMKSEFKNFIDCMSNEEFIDFISFLGFSFADFENEDWTFDEVGKTKQKNFIVKEIINLIILIMMNYHFNRFLC